MKAKVINIDNNEISEMEVNQDLFGAYISPAVIKDVINWQLAKRQAGTHKTKGLSEVSGTGKKPFKQKGTGNARLGTLRAAQCRGGATIFGPLPRDHSHSLPKKVRKLGLKMALAQKLEENQVMLLDDFESKDISTKSVREKLSSHYSNSLLIIDANENTNTTFKKSLQNLKGVNFLPTMGANVYDLVKHEKVFITKKALIELEERLK